MPRDTRKRCVASSGSSRDTLLRMSTLAALFTSRKFWLGTATVAAMLGGVALRIAGKIEASDLIATISGLAVVGTGAIGAIAWEDRAAPNWIDDMDRRHISPPAARPEDVAGVSNASTPAPSFVLSFICISDRAPFIRRPLTTDKFNLLIQSAKELMHIRGGRRGSPLRRLRNSYRRPSCRSRS